MILISTQLPSFKITKHPNSKKYKALKLNK